MRVRLIDNAGKVPPWVVAVIDADMRERQAAENTYGIDVEFYAELQEIAANTFPKRCLACGRSGLKQSVDDGGHVIVELFRHCVCGSTLMDCFTDRRDASETGKQDKT